MDQLSNQNDSDKPEVSNARYRDLEYGPTR